MKSAKIRAKKPIPFEFILEQIDSLRPHTKPMFGCTGVYVGEKIILILRDKTEGDPDNGIWLATQPHFHESLKQDVPSMRSIHVFGPGPTAWQNLPKDSDSFEEEAIRVCELVLSGDERIGKIPASRKLRKTKSKPVSRRGRRVTTKGKTPKKSNQKRKG